MQQKVIMNCSKCCFAQCTPPSSGGPFGIWQEGCKANRLEKFLERGEASIPQKPVFDFEENNQYYELTRFCNMNRDYNWYKSKEGSSDEILAIAKKESDVNFGILIDIDKQSEQELKNTINSIKEIDYASDKITCVISVLEKNLHTQIYANLVEELKSEGVNCKLVIHFTKQQLIIDTDSITPIMDARSAYVCKVVAGALFDSNVCSKVNACINKDLEQVTVFDSSGSILINRNVINGLYMEYQDYNLMVNGVLSLSKEQNNYKKI